MAKGNKKSTSGKKSEKKVASKTSIKLKGMKSRRTLNSYIKKVSKRSCSSKAIRVVNSMCFDQLDKIAVQAAALARSAGKRTMKSGDVQAAVRMLFPSDLAKHIVGEAGKAVSAFSKATPKVAKKTAKK